MLAHERGPDGVFAVHGYPISDEVSTFIVETDEDSWRRAGLDEFDVTQPPGASDLISAPGFVAASHAGWRAAHGGAEPLDSPFTHDGWSAPGRLVAVSAAADGSPALVAGGSAPLPLLPLAASGHSARPGPWGAAVTAPDSESGLPGVFARLAALAADAAPPVLVAVHGGTPLTRILVCEQARLHERLPALVIADPALAPDETSFRDRALTTVLSGRADLVGRPA